MLIPSTTCFCEDTLTSSREWNVSSKGKIIDAWVAVFSCSSQLHRESSKRSHLSTTLHSCVQLEILVVRVTGCSYGCLFVWMFVWAAPSLALNGTVPGYYPNTVLHVPLGSISSEHAMTVPLGLTGLNITDAKFVCMRRNPLANGLWWSLYRSAVVLCSWCLRVV